MKAYLEINGRNMEVDFSTGEDISIPLLFNGAQPNTYNVEKAISKPYSDSQFIGDTRMGGPCNFETYRITPHCNGTHTECVGHITKERVSILNSLNEEMILSTLISLMPENSKENKIHESIFSSIKNAKKPKITNNGKFFENVSKFL